MKRNTPSSSTLGRTRRLAALLMGLALVALSVRFYGLSFNVTDSMPIGFYHLEPVQLPVKRGTIVQACLPRATATLGRSRGYLIRGSCSDGSAPVLKIVAATGGDRVELLEARVVVNGRPLPGSGTVPNDAHGRRLSHIARRTFILGRGELWLWSPNPASWDSRYYGPVPEPQVLGRATLLVAFGSWNFGLPKR